MKVLSQAKEFLKEFEGRLETENPMDAFVAVTDASPERTEKMNASQLCVHNGGMHLFTSALQAVVAETKQLTIENIPQIEQEIDRRHQTILTGWQKGAGIYTKDFDSPSDVLDFIKVLSECGLRAKTTQSVSDDTCRLFMSETTYQNLMLLFEGRQMEIT